ncbi:MAG TPA: sulfate permease [Candidatus Limnocylindrales bacterium]|nr:sulfate permease [Candidatus Limnocylindrales bacterium]
MSDGAAGERGRASLPAPVARRLPGLAVLLSYQPRWLPRDIGAGLVLTAILVPAGMGYAEASGLPAITGLYATIVPLLVYALMGPSRILVLGPDSSLVALVAAAVLPLSAADPEQAVAVAGLLALLTGGVIAVLGIARLGFVTELLSDPVRNGYLTGIAVTVVVSQLPKLFGFSVDGVGFIGDLIAFAGGLADGLTVPAALGLGIVSLVVIYALKLVRFPIPGILIAVVGATLASGVLGLEESAGISVVGVLPSGLPGFSVPPIELDLVIELLPAAIGIAVVAAADTSVLSRTFAARHGEDVDPDQELIGLGAANAAAGFFSGFPVSSSSSRTPVAESAGARTQLTGVVGALAVTGLIVVAPGLLAPLPSATLAAVVIVAATSLVDLPALVRLYQVRRSEFLLAALSFGGVVFLGVIPGIFLAVAMSIIVFVRRSWQPHDAVLGRAKGVKGYHDLHYYPSARQIPGLLIYRFDAPLFFANADVFGDRILARIRASDVPVRWVVVAAEPITDVDTTAATKLDLLLDDLEQRGIVLAFAGLKDFVKDRLRTTGTLERIGEDRLFPTMGTAVDAYVHATGTSWIDWEEAAQAGEPGAWGDWIPPAEEATEAEETTAAEDGEPPLDAGGPSTDPTGEA